MNRREQIRMTAAEVATFLAEERTVTCATVGPRGWPHLMPLWYVLRGHSADEPGPRIWSWTYGSSQKVRNVERDARATLQVEAGEEYSQLRGVMLECDVVVHREITEIVRLGAEIMMRNSVPRGAAPPEDLPQDARDAVAAQAGKRVGLEFVELRRVSWDHRKLGGTY
ncbi:MAG TPA: pyridoxamine 5'-phosphate oxidase family protein [Solirubrobacteraceae bacterium]|jgi:nitroimidazol reductase NimA-like FMN-containing flavoprotein (pyridoxamine 5'-phosphate oxidase superfamily)|nr:pyridoxamine 5'-phosphate oxidase family protein [Solirubrobacteraceae bacterium]